MASEIAEFSQLKPFKMFLFPNAILMGMHMKSITLKSLKDRRCWIAQSLLLMCCWQKIDNNCSFLLLNELALVNTCVYHQIVDDILYELISKTFSICCIQRMAPPSIF